MMDVTQSIFEAVASGDLSEVLHLQAIYLSENGEQSLLWHSQIRAFLPCIFELASDSQHDSKAHTLFSAFPDEEDMLIDMEDIDFRSIAARVKSKYNATSLSSPNEQSLESTDVLLDFETCHENSLRRILTWILYCSSNPRSTLHHEVLSAEICHSQINALVFSICFWLPDFVNIHTLVRFLIIDTPGNDIDMSSVHVLNLVKNLPHWFRDIVDSLLRWSVDEKELGSVCKHILSAMSDIAPGQALAMRTTLVIQAALPELVLHLSVTVLKDFNTFVLGLIHDPGRYKWFVEKYLLGDVKAEELSRHFLYLEAHASSAEVLRYSTRTHRFLCCYFRILCIIFRPGALSTYVQQLPTAQDNVEKSAHNLGDRMVDMITSETVWQDENRGYRTHHPNADACRSSQFVKLALCVIVSCPLLTNPNFIPSVRVTAWLQNLAARAVHRDAVHSVGHHDMLRLMGVHFATENVRAVADLVRTELGFHIDIPVESLRRVSDVFGRHVYADGSLLEHLMRAAPTAALHRDTSGFLPVHSVHQLLRTRLFVRYQVQPLSWVLAQIRSLAPDRALHPQMTGILECYADFAADPHGTALSGNDHPPRTEEQEWYTTPLQPLAHDDVTAVMAETNPVAKVAVLFYVLTYNKAVNARALRLRRSGSSRSRRENAPYPVEFLRRLPLRALLHAAEASADSLYPDVFPHLHGLLLFEFPEYFLVHDKLRDNLTLAVDSCHPLQQEFSLARMLVQSCRRTSTAARSGASSTAATTALSVRSDGLFDPLGDPTAALATLTELTGASHDDLIVSADAVVGKMIEALKTHASHTEALSMRPGQQAKAGNLVDRRLQSAFLDVWHRLCTLMPHHLWGMTVQALHHAHDKLSAATDSHEEVLQDPLAILRCDRAHLLCPTIMEMVLSLLDAHLAASEGVLQLQCNAAASALGGGDGMGNEGSAVFDRIVLTQRASVVHVLLEICADARRTQEITGAAAEIHVLLCKFFHQMFIHYPILVKLVHFQGYDWDIIPTMVLGVPSMHICLDFLGELLEQPNSSQQVFAVLVGGALAKRYTIPKMLEVTRAILGKANDICNSDLVSRITFFTPTLGSFVHICDAFPLMTEGVLQLFMSLLSLQRSEEAMCTMRDSSTDGLSDDIVRRFTEAVESAIEAVSPSAFMSDAI